MRARALGVLVAVAAVAVGVVLATRSDEEARPPGPLVVEVDVSHPGRTIPRSFLGLSIEYQSVPIYLGAGGKVNRAFSGLVGALGRAQRSPVALRIGGNSSDESWWNPRRRPRPHGVLYDIGPAWARSLAHGQAALRAPLALGLNLALGDAANAAALVGAVRAAGLRAPGITALEIGNEPDLFPRARTFRVGRLVVHRPRQRLRYDPATYVREASSFVDALTRRLTDPPPLALGGFATEAWAKAAIPPLLAREGGRIAELTTHTYALRECNSRTPAGELRARLLTDAASRGLAQALDPYRADSSAHRLGVRVAELNSAVCGGAPGVSDTFAAALWAPDALFALAAAGARQADLHTWAGSFYAPFAFSKATRAGATAPVAAVRPLYLGMLLFARAAPAGSRLLATRVTEPGDARAWATRDAQGHVRMVLVNRSAGVAREVRVALGGGVRRATVWRLRAPALDARSGTTLGGRGFPRPTATGEPSGNPDFERLVVRHGETSLHLPPASAALIVAR